MGAFVLSVRRRQEPQHDARVYEERGPEKRRVAELLREETDPLRRFAILSQMESGQQEARATLQAVLAGGSRDDFARFLSVAYADRTRWAPDVAAALPNVTDPGTRLEMMDFLGSAGAGESCQEALLDLFRQGDGDVRRWALSALSRYAPRS